MVSLLANLAQVANVNNVSPMAPAKSVSIHTILFRVTNLQCPQLNSTFLSVRVSLAKALWTAQKALTLITRRKNADPAMLAAVSVLRHNAPSSAPPHVLTVSVLQTTALLAMGMTSLQVLEMAPSPVSHR